MISECGGYCAEESPELPIEEVLKLKLQASERKVMRLVALIDMAASLIGDDWYEWSKAVEKEMQTK